MGGPFLKLGGAGPYRRARGKGLEGKKGGRRGAKMEEAGKGGQGPGKGQGAGSREPRGQGSRKQKKNTAWSAQTGILRNHV